MTNIILICPSNIDLMPYVSNYTKIFRDLNLKYDILNWDRLQIESLHEHRFKDKKSSVKRRLKDYLSYRNFVLNKLKTNNYTHIIVFGIQMTFLLQNYLLGTKSKYIIDVRDLHKSYKFINYRVIKNAHGIVVSAPGFSQIFKNKQVIINHNFNISKKTMQNYMGSLSFDYSREKKTISNIGTARDKKINIELIESLANNENYKLNFHGAGGVEDDIKNYCNSNGIYNVEFTGRYDEKVENVLYRESTMVNVLRYNDSMNNYYALPNRLYNAPLNLRPLLAFNGTELSKIIAQNNIGLVLDSIDDAENTINNYFNEFDPEIFKRSCKLFLEGIIEENQLFNKNIENFIFKK